MAVVPVLLLCSLCLVAAAVVLFVFSARQGDCERGERLCLLPLEDDDAGGESDANVSVSLEEESPHLKEDPPGEGCRGRPLSRP